MDPPPSAIFQGWASLIAARHVRTAVNGSDGDGWRSGRQMRKYGIQGTRMEAVDGAALGSADVQARLRLSPTYSWTSTHPHAS
jgi:hypothetical protein